jgi:ubiquinone/menaquinone biosynthesis C-methylase UbiE
MNRLENWFCASPFWRRITRERLLPWALEEINLGDRVLEIGAGPGAATAELARRARSVTSLEYSHKFCVDLKSKIGAQNVVQGDAAILPFATGTFTATIAVLVLHHLRSMEAQDRAFAEIYRVLEPGGVFVALEVDDSWLTRVAHFRSTFVALAPKTAGERVRAAGFSKIELTSRSGGFRLRAQRPGIAADRSR